MSMVWSSLRNRIAIVATAVTFVVLVLVAVLLLVNQQRQLDAAVDSALEAEIGNVQSELLINFATLGPRAGNSNGDRPQRPDRGVDLTQLERFARGSNNNFQLFRIDGEVLLNAGRFSSEVPILDPETLFDGGNDGSFQTVSDENDRRFRVAAAPAGEQLALVVGYSLSDVDRAQASLRRTLLVTLPALAALLGFVTWFFVGRALAPVDQMRRDVDAISPTDLDGRVTTPETTELSALASTMNAMLGRIQTSVERQQQFVSDASHELRSPLTGMRGQLEVNITHPEAPDRDVAEREMLEETIRMQTLVEDLLALARSDQGRQHMATTVIDLDDVVLSEVARQRRKTDVRIETSVDVVQVRGNADQLTRVLRNLMGNALRHAETAVSVSLRESGDGVHLIVSDDGPGVPEAMQPRVFERFTRSDEARDRDSGGSGLGLAICRAVAEAHGGSIELQPPSRFVVRLPAST